MLFRFVAPFLSQRRALYTYMLYVYKVYLVVSFCEKQSRQKNVMCLVESRKKLYQKAITYQEAIAAAAGSANFLLAVQVKLLNLSPLKPRFFLLQRVRDAIL